MTVRTSMSGLIAQARLLANDPSGATAVFTDQQIQDFLDKNAYQEMYEQLSPVENIAAGGLVEYKKFCAEQGYWENDAELTNGNYEPLTPSESDSLAGVWKFATSQSLPVLIYGIWYDLNATAAELWRLKATKFAEQFDASVDGATYNLSQKYYQALSMAKEYRSKAVRYSGITYLRRSDVAN